MERAGHVYSRISNPTCAVLEERIAALEGGVGAIATASGQAALHLAIVSLMGAGSHIVASRALYGGSHNCSPTRCRASASRRPSSTPAISTPGAPPSVRRRGSCSAKRWAIPASTCSTFRASRRLRTSTACRSWPMRRSLHLTSSKPFAHGADLVFHSATKFLSGHGVVIGGLLVDSGQFDWDGRGARKFPTLTEPYAGFHDMVFAEESTTAGFLLRARREGIRDFGACMSPFTAFQILQGMETLPLRMARHVDNARRIVGFLAAHPSVEAVGYPELPGHPDHALAATLLPRGCGAVFSFNIKGTRAQGRRFIETLKLFSHLANVGDAKSLVIHPASTTHFRMAAEDLAKAGITEGTIRLSVGLEHPDDLIEDLLARLARRRPKRDAALGRRRRRLRVHRLEALVRTQPSVVFVHGAGNEHSGLGPAISLFRASREERPRHRSSSAHGKSGGAALPSVEALADWIHALLDAAETRPRAACRPLARIAGEPGMRRAASRARGEARVDRPPRRRCPFPKCCSMPRCGTITSPASSSPAGRTARARSSEATRCPGCGSPANALRLLERAKPGVLHADLAACDRYGARTGQRGQGALPDARHPRRARRHGAAFEPRRASLPRCRTRRSSPFRSAGTR
jgi:O-acetylhomoserine (thiol)-lyase